MDKSDIKKILEREETLNYGGFGLIILPEKLSVENYNNKLNELRVELLNSSEICTKVCDWLKDIAKIKTINKNYSSYNLKHIIEKRTGYVSNGVLICAAIFLGFKFVVEGPNAYFNMSNKSLKQLEQLIN